MLRTQEYLHKYGIEKLQEEFAINVFRHPELPLIGLKYSQLDSKPRNHPVIRECRGLVLEDKTWKLVAKPFSRFFNIGEYEDELKKFNWNHFTSVEKTDGSLIIVYNYNGTWHANTSGSFGLGQAQEYQGTWRDLFWKVYNDTVFWDACPLSIDNTYCFELCTIYNKVVKGYKEPSAFLIGAVDNRNLHEFSEQALDNIAGRSGLKRPRYYAGVRLQDVLDTINRLDSEDEMQEGLVLRDNGNRRWKLKTEGYLLAHKLKDNGNILRGDRLTKIVLENKDDDIGAKIPEVKGALEQVKAEMISALYSVYDLWLVNKGAESQKDFAMAVKDHKLSWILFNLRKNAPSEEKTRARIQEIMLDNYKKVADTLFSKRVFEYNL